MGDEIKQVIGQLEKHDVSVVVFCDHRAWTVNSAHGDELHTCSTAREAFMFLSGVLHFAIR